MLGILVVIGYLMMGTFHAGLHGQKLTAAICTNNLKICLKCSTMCKTLA